MKTLFLSLLLIPSLSWAHCPNEIKSEDQTYCLEINWDLGEKKIKGEFQSTNEETPYLIPHKEIQQKWIFSQAIIDTWKKGDPNHEPVAIPNFKVFAYMHMKNGHHHPAGKHDFFFDENYSQYILRRVAFHSMAGCWSLRWTIKNEEKLETSHFLSNLTDFANLTANGIKEQKEYCANYGKKADNNSGHHNHH